MARNYWLLKSEPTCFSIADLERSPKQTASWDGVRNYQARNFMRDQFRCGDLAFFYHSSTNPPAVVGVCEVVKEAYPDDTAFDPKEQHYDPKSDPAKPRWFMVDVKLRQRFARPITLSEMRTNRKLHKMQLLQRGQRLSVQPVSKSEWQEVLRMAGLSSRNI